MYKWIVNYLPNTTKLIVQVFSFTRMTEKMNSNYKTVEFPVSTKSCILFVY